MYKIVVGIAKGCGSLLPKEENHYTFRTIPPKH